MALAIELAMFNFLVLQLNGRIFKPFLPKVYFSIVWAARSLSVMIDFLKLKQVLHADSWST